MRGLLILLLFLAFCISAEAQNKVGIVVEITGTARLIDANRKEHKLTGRNFAVSVSTGQSLKADGNGTVQVEFCNGEVRTIRKRLYRIPAVICSSTASSEKLAVFESVLVLADEEVAMSSFYFRPNDVRTIIRPETALIRWRSTTEKLTLSIRITGQAQPIWKQEVDGEQATFDSDELKAFLAKVRQKLPNAKLQLRLNSGLVGIDKVADFLIFSLQQEENLKKELAETSSEHGILKHFARAIVYSHHGLQIELASELEEALKLSPESIELLMATASAQEGAGNGIRSNELDEQWRILTK